MAGGSPFISDAMWALWQQCVTFIPGVRLGGIYANKSGYHNTVDANQLSWPGDYSIQLSYDLKKPHDKARAIDLTMDDANMRQRTGYMQRSALDPRDDRLRHLREFYGTLNSVTVYGLIKDSPDGPWRAASSDTSHLWHVHASVFTEFVNDTTAMAAHASVLSGQSWEAWTGSQPITPTARRASGMFRLIDPDNKQFVISPDTLSPTGWSYVPIVNPDSVHGWGLVQAGIGTANGSANDPNRDPHANNTWRPGTFGPTKQEVRAQFLTDVVARVVAALPPSQGGAGPTLAEIAKAVRIELDRTKLTAG